MKRGDKLWHNCDVDILEFKVLGITEYEGFNHYTLQSVNTVGAQGIIKIIITNQGGSFRFIDLIGKDLYETGLDTWLEGIYHTTKVGAEIESYEIQLKLVGRNIERISKNLTREKYHYKKYSELLNTLKITNDNRN